MRDVRCEMLESTIHVRSSLINGESAMEQSVMASYPESRYQGSGRNLLLFRFLWIAKVSFPSRAIYGYAKRD